MGDWLDLAVWLLLLAIPGAGMVACLLSIRRSLRWTRVDAVVCADAEHLRLPPAQRPASAQTVVFEGPSGPCVARLGYVSDEEDFPVGSTIRIVFNPADPGKVAIPRSVVWHAVFLMVFGGTLAFLLTFPWKIDAPG